MTHLIGCRVGFENAGAVGDRLGTLHQFTDVGLLHQVAVEIANGRSLSLFGQHWVLGLLLYSAQGFWWTNYDWGNLDAHSI